MTRRTDAQGALARSRRRPRGTSKITGPLFILAAAVVVSAAVLALLQSRPDPLPGADRPRVLPVVNAALNTTSGVLLITGFALIRMKMRRAHMVVMLLALLATCLFLVTYLYYHSRVGSVSFTAEGAVRTVYFTILTSHTVLAALVAPLVATVLYRAARGQFDRHRGIARWTLPLWLYVSITGVLIYLMLYVWYPGV